MPQNKYSRVNSLDRSRWQGKRDSQPKCATTERSEGVEVHEAWEKTLAESKTSQQ